MNARFRLLVLLLALAALGACGRIHSRVVVAPEKLGVIEQVALLPAEVSSREQTNEALALNAEWQTLAQQELEAAIGSRGIKIARRDAKNRVVARIEVIYGNRALRYFVGFGAGSGHLAVTVELRDARGKVRYATSAEADLAGGLWGGDMSEVVRTTVRAAAEDFATRL
ncbi:MAG TPA: DUF4410 domain-containing protein [Terriglobales bacterium]|nr:DUF4410 domain-containing protein [Terriglobales bacterium]